MNSEPATERLGADAFRGLLHVIPDDQPSNFYGIAGWFALCGAPCSAVSRGAQTDGVPLCSTCFPQPEGEDRKGGGGPDSGAEGR
jgi:hypothetical protein